jgi:hypothetical protein
MSAAAGLSGPGESATTASEALSASQSSGGTVPTYLTNEISSLQAGLARLTGQSSRPGFTSYGRRT